MSSSITLLQAQLPSPLGVLSLQWDALQQLHALSFAPLPAAPAAACPKAIGHAITAYFDGELHWLDALPCAASGTAFQLRVWAALRQLAPGTHCSYAALASAIGAPRAVRAVGMANKRNPIAIVVPCHRVIGADGRLTGYAGGLDRKQWLLDHERRYRPFAPDAGAPQTAELAMR